MKLFNEIYQVVCSMFLIIRTTSLTNIGHHQHMYTRIQVFVDPVLAKGTLLTPCTAFDVPQSDIRPQLQQYKAERNCTAVTIQVIA